MMDKLTRYKSIMTQKNKIIKLDQEKVKMLQLSNETLKHDFNMSNQIVENQKKQLDYQQNQMEKTGNAKKLEKANNVLSKELDEIRESNSILNKENSDLNEKLKVKSSLVKSLQEELGVEDVADVEREVEIVEEATVQTVSMNKGSTVHECNACDKKYKTSNDLENHVRSKHNEKQCIYCSKTFNNEHNLAKHHQKCDSIEAANSKCNKCNKNFTKPGLMRHQPGCHGTECPVCGEMFTNPNTLKRHEDDEHKMEVVKSKEICYHWRRGHCFKGDECKFSHAGHQNSRAHTNKSTTRVAPCKNGPSCDWLKKGSCSFYHHKVGVQRQWVKQGEKGGRQEARSHQQPSRAQTQPQIVQPDRAKCKFEGRCERIPNCPWIHSLEDFPAFQGRRSQGPKRTNNQRRN